MYLHESHGLLISGGNSKKRKSLFKAEKVIRFVRLIEDSKRLGGTDKLQFINLVLQPSAVGKFKIRPHAVHINDIAPRQRVFSDINKLVTRNIQPDFLENLTDNRLIAGFTCLHASAR